MQKRVLIVENAGVENMDLNVLDNCPNAVIQVYEHGYEESEEESDLKKPDRIILKNQKTVSNHNLKSHQKIASILQF